jgi:retron-type reverse transcriptase
MKAAGGPAPGHDGVSYDDLSRSEVCEAMRELSKSLLLGTYVPQPARSVKIPKQAGGHRELALSDITHRVVGTALKEALTPLWETIFLPASYGFRPGRSTWTLLADLKHAVETQNRWVIAVDDVKQAFDNVSIGDALADHRRHLTAPEVLQLIEIVLRGGENRQVGIAQGCPYSPTTLNLRLHYALDTSISRYLTNPPLYRYADNLAFACSSASEGKQALNQAGQLLQPAGLTLKHSDQPVDLRSGGEIQLLGSTLSHRDGELALELGQSAWTSLKQDLLEAHNRTDPVKHAQNVVNGWISAFGPAFKTCRSDLTNQILSSAAECGFRELGNPALLIQQMEMAWDHWQTTLLGRLQHFSD